VRQNYEWTSPIIRCWPRSGLRPTCHQERKSSWMVCNTALSQSPLNPDSASAAREIAQAERDSRKLSQGVSSQILALYAEAIKKVKEPTLDRISPFIRFSHHARQLRTVPKASTKGDPDEPAEAVHFHFSVRPSLTCLWQVHSRSDVYLDEWVCMYLEYIDNWSLWLDFKILMRTIPSSLKREGSILIWGFHTPSSVWVSLAIP
jgi:hypothetical protein